MSFEPPHAALLAGSFGAFGFTILLVVLLLVPQRRRRPSNAPGIAKA